MSLSIYYPNTPYILPTSSPVVIDISYVGIIPSNTFFSISPTLPDGLNIDPSNGIISGTTLYSSITPLKTYTVDASYSSGIVTTNLQISVDFLPTFFYPNTPYIIEQDLFQEIRPIYLISNIQGITYNLISSPPLSDISMNLNSGDGVIYGTPSVFSLPTNYTIRSNNNGIIYDAIINISVKTLPTISYPDKTYILTQSVEVSIFPITSILNTGVTYSITGCALPSGLIFDTTTGEIYGTPLLPTTFREYIVTATNVVGSSTTIIILNIIKVILAPRVVADNIDSGLCLTNPIMSMRRKAEVLKYKKNSAGFTKNQNWSLAIKGNGPYAKRVWANQNGLVSNPNISGLPVEDNIIICNTAGILCTPTSSSDVPGPIMNLCYDPNVPLIGYNQPNRTRVNIGFKWPQRAWQIGDMGFPVGKAGSNNS